MYVLFMCPPSLPPSPPPLLPPLPSPPPSPPPQVYSDIEEDPYKDTGGEDTVALTGVENQYFPQMKDWILDFLETTAEHSVVSGGRREGGEGGECGTV